MRVWTMGAGALALVAGCGQADLLKPHSPGWLLQGSGTSGKNLPWQPEPARTSPLVEDLSSHLVDLRGAIANQDGSQAQVLAGWVVAAFGRSTSEARVAEVDAAGLYTLSKVDVREPQTLALFSADYVLQAVLSMPSPVPNSIRQFFKPRTGELPRLINRGPIITFQSTDGLEITRDLASDQNGDGIPDGAVSIQPSALMLDGLLSGPSDSAQDLDLDGIPNEKDPDIDGDGLINVLDLDDNGNGQLDVFDPDANGDYQPDNAPGQEDTDGYFKRGVEFAAAQLLIEPRADGTNGTSLMFRAKVREGVVPLGVQVRGAPSLLNNSYFETRDELGQVIHTAFNRLLGDDGLSDDGGAGDRVFGKKVFLDAGKVPRPGESLFFQLVFGSLEHPWYMEFPVVFPPLRPAMITAQFDPATRTALLVGNPFGEHQEFVWTVQIFDDRGRDQGPAVWKSQAIPGDTRMFAIPGNLFEAGRSYSFQLRAQSQDKIPGLPGVIVATKTYPINSASP